MEIPKDELITSPALLFFILFPAILSERVSRDSSHHKGGLGGGFGHLDDHGGGYGHLDDHGGGYGHGGGHGGGYGHGGDHGGYKPHGPKKCHPQTITKYKTIYKDRKAEVVNQVEILNPRPHVKKITETRYTTIRYPVFITQVIKPLLTQVETKVKPVFFTDTIDKYTTVLFTVTGIGQVTVTKVKYEKEYITRCMKKGYHRRDYPPEEGPEVKEQGIILPLETKYQARPTKIPPPPGVPYDEPFNGPIPKFENFLPTPDRIFSPFGKRTGNSSRKPSSFPISPPRRPLGPFMKSPRGSINRRGHAGRGDRFPGRIGRIDDLYSGDVYYKTDRSGRFLEASSVLGGEEYRSIGHPALLEQPLRVLA